MNISGTVSIFIGLDENKLSINDVIGVLVLRILVPFWPPLAEFVALMDAVWMFRKEYTVVRAVWGDGRLQTWGAVKFDLNELPSRYECNEWGTFNKESLVFGILNLHMGEARRGNRDVIFKACGIFCCMTESFDS